ncbi:MAG: glycine betaine ABC transporter substrate-binding protein [Burkholderiaceae bacterium]
MSPSPGFRARAASFCAVACVALSMLAAAGPASADAGSAPAKEVKVGSKRFTESYILGEIVLRTLLERHVPAIHKAGLGNTGILVAALNAGEIDVYPEYTGTIVREILKRDGNPSLDELDALLAPMHLKVAIPLGFSNTYALAMREDEAVARGIARISDLVDVAKTRGLHLGLSNEFLARGDGWPALKAAYALPLETPSGLDHGLAYDALAQKRVDLIDIYSTDARIGRDGVRVLIDDRHFFPTYDAVLLMRRDLDVTPLETLRGAIDNATMIALNGRAELDHVPFAEVAAAFVAKRSGHGGAAATVGDSPRARFFHKLFGPDFWRLLVEHVVLVAGSVAAATVVAVPLGVWSARSPLAARVILNVVGVLQTVPSLALLALLITLLGTIGTVPALIALFLYALLPIVANTHAGMAGVSRGIVQAAAALGLTARQRLVHIELPLAAPTLVAGIRTAAVINVGTATMAAFVGAGGFGERITAGLALNDGTTMLAGAIPAAALALITQWLFDAIGRTVDFHRKALAR